LLDICNHGRYRVLTTGRGQRGAARWLLRNRRSKFQDYPGNGVPGSCCTGREARRLGLFNDGVRCRSQYIDSPLLAAELVKNSNHWITLKMVGGPKSRASAIEPRYLLRWRRAARGDVSAAELCSSSDQRLHFGSARVKVDK